MQTRFKENRVPPEKRQEFRISFDSTSSVQLRKEIINSLELDGIVHGGKQLQRTHTWLNRKPEDVTEELIVDPILKFLGYESLGKSSGSAGNIDRREADYSLQVNGERILVEAEPLNKQLYDVKKQGVEQLKSNLEKRSFRAILGIATNGFEWALLKYDDTKSFSCKQVEEATTNLRPLFNAVLDGEGSLRDKERIFDTFYTYFAYENIIDASDEFTRILEEKRQNVTSTFYQDYILYVFGYDTKNNTHKKSLLTTLRAPSRTSENSKRLFVMTLMSRLIFLEFLEDKGLVRQRFLSNLLKWYKEGRIPSSFYRAYLQPVFYDVLNTPFDKRNQKILEMPQFENIPYLNGGLFREVVEDELQFDVPNDIIEAVIDLLEGYNFTLKDNPDTLNPDILGLVFEKTINYLTGQGETDRRRDLGAYYTPDDVTTYISTETIQKRIFDIIREYLQAIGATKVDQYNSLEDFLDNPRLNPKVIKGVYERVSEIAVLDPACGSGHFLTSILKELFRIRKNLRIHLNENLDYYDIKRDIVARNLFGVDIESSAIEIAQLRLWLALIEDLDIRDQHARIDTLPNIEYNIEHGNSLFGYTSAPDATQMKHDIQKTLPLRGSSRK